MNGRTLTVRVARIVRLTADIRSFELVHPRGGTLPGYAPGAHIDVHTPGGFTRQYSLAQAAPGPGPVQRYVIGVKREATGRGGSVALHDRVGIGDLLPVSTPQSGFALHPGAGHHLLLAGGIGITPLLAMAQHLRTQRAGFTLCVFARSPAQLAFAGALQALGPNVRLHFDRPASARKIELALLLARHPPDTHLYLCGPAGFMDAARAAAAHWPAEAIHLEHFAAPDAAQARPAEAFKLRLARRGFEVEVAAGQTAVDALHDIGVEIPTSCGQGLCGTCVVHWLPADGGGPEHRDHCLGAAERGHQVALCCSRAPTGTTLVLDL